MPRNFKEEFDCLHQTVANQADDAANREGKLIT